MTASFPQSSKQKKSHFFGIREPIKPYSAALLGILPVVCILAGWTLLTVGEAENRIISPLILPSPLEVVAAMRSLWFDAGLSRSIVASLFRVLLGFGAGIAIAFPLGIMMGSFTKINALFEPLMVFGGYLPIPALLPLTMSLFGIGEFQKIMFLALAFIVYLLPLIVKAVSEIDTIYLQTAYTMGATRRQLVRYVLFSIAAPRIYQSIRLGFGIGWSYIILAEMVAADHGLGSIIIVAQRRGPREYIYLVLIVIVLIAYLADKLLKKIGNLFFPYLEEK